MLQTNYFSIQILSVKLSLDSSPLISLHQPVEPVMGPQSNAIVVPVPHSPLFI